ncbi:hypothetical protein [Polyangium aurulentum]|uniref:hypothetical protein n=1 Tax=Polyangium aurulentum TaxID=2567896 RepID=UPI0010AE5E87|nr:hypothetical protein [Polyangium aurulentum]UQA57265.1 hypothetical protein E8A73_039195 [Polyangium aurulentum]
MGGTGTGASSSGSTTGAGGTGASGGAGGSSGGGGSGGAGGGQQGNWVPPPPVTMPPLPPPPDYSGYPVDAQGRTIVSMGARINWVIPSTHDAMSARELCADLVANCFEPGVRSIDACMMSAPHCTTPEPWTEPSPCCADACFTAFATQRKSGVDPITAYLRVLYDTPICMPGVDAMLGGAP